MSNGDLDRDTRMGMPVAQYQVGAKLSPRISQGNVFARSAYLRLNAVTWTSTRRVRANAGRLSSKCRIKVIT